MKLGFTCGNFNLVTANHIVFFERAKSLCDKLIVFIDTDTRIENLKGKEKLILTTGEKHIILSSVKYIDEIFFFDTKEEMFEKIENRKRWEQDMFPLNDVSSFFIKSGEYNWDTLVEKDWLVQQGILPVLLPPTKYQSTTDIVNKIKESK